jgi:hypothetical protein
MNKAKKKIPSFSSISSPNKTVNLFFSGKIKINGFQLSDSPFILCNFLGEIFFVVSRRSNPVASVPFFVRKSSS